MPINLFAYNLPIDYISMPETTTPTCSRCYMSLDLAHLPAPPQEAEAERARVAPIFAGQGLPTDKPARKPRQPVPTIDDLLF